MPYTHEDSASLFLLGQAMSASFLHREIREKGGAYGGGASASPIDGVFGTGWGALPSPSQLTF